MSSSFVRIVQKPGTEFGRRIGGMRYWFDSDHDSVMLSIQTDECEILLKLSAIKVEHMCATLQEQLKELRKHYHRGLEHLSEQEIFNEIIAPQLGVSDRSNYVSEPEFQRLKKKYGKSLGSSTLISFSRKDPARRKSKPARRKARRGGPLRPGD